ncbi:MAG: branched-chain amino acid ABC transporter substrate-binding protein [SAR324 cluster bacterium]|nr:branched-chain amino acid ABC transporter substrate-binding protein [SAR324 cluster bacterium]
MAKNLIKFGLLVGTISVVLGGCFKKDDTIKIGVAGPFTGQYAAFGEQIHKGTEKAAADINAAGGVNGKSIELVFGDDACDPKQAVTVANKLTGQDKVIAVVGHFCSSSSIPASEIYAASGILNVTPASTNPTYTERGLDNVFRTCGRDDQQGAVAGNYLINKLNAKKVVILHDKDTYGQGLADATKKVLNESGVNEILYEGVTRGDKDFNALVTKIKGLGPDVVYFGGLHTEAGLLVRQMREQGVDVPFISGDGIVSQDFVISVGGAQYTKNVFMTFGSDPLKLETGKKVVESFKDDGYQPEGYTLYSYAALQAVVIALSATDLDSSAAAMYLKDNSVSTVMGEKSWDSKGDLTVSDYVMYAWDGDSYSELE